VPFTVFPPDHWRGERGRDVRKRKRRREINKTNGTREKENPFFFRARKMVRILRRARLRVEGNSQRNRGEEEARLFF